MNQRNRGIITVLMLSGLLNNSYLRDQVMTKVMTKAPGNVAPILPIETAVIGGRSFWGWKRSGFLELQERFIEEAVVAAVWLFGVSSVGKLIDKGITCLQKKGKLKGVYADADWSKSLMRQFTASQSSKPSILLSPLEKYTATHSNLVRTLLVKGAKFGVAVSVPLFLCGYAIPKLNQLKTEWILKTFYGGKDPHLNSHGTKPNGHSVLFAQNSPARGNASTPYPTLQAPPSLFAANSSFDSLTHGNTHVFNSPAPFPVYDTSKTKPRFGFSGSKALSWLSQTGHAINNSHFGEVLVVDIGVTGGRMATAWPRSPFESLEYGARDVGSLFFYLMSVPLGMNLASKLFQSSWGSAVTKRLFGQDFGNVIKLDQQVIQHLNQSILNAAGTQSVTPEKLSHIIHGVTKPELEALKPVLRHELRQVSAQKFMTWLEHELMATTTTPKQASQAKKLLEATQAHLKQLKLRSGKLSAEQLQQLLENIWNRKGTFKTIQGLTDANKFHLTNAAKHAFHHQAGLSAEALQKIILQKAGHTLSAVDKEQLLNRINQITRLEGDKTIGSVLRRSMSIAHQSGKLSVSQSQKLETLIRSIEQASLQAKPLNSYVTDTLEDILSQYQHYQTGNKIKPNKALQTSLHQVRQLLRGELTFNSPKQLTNLFETLAEQLRLNGRNYPKGLRWMQGFGLNHLANEVDKILPLVQEQTSLSKAVNNQVDTVMTELLKAVEKNAPQHTLLLKNHKLIKTIQAAGGRYYLPLTRSTAQSLPEFITMLDTELNALLRGGIRWNVSFFKKALKTTLHLPAGTDQFYDPSEAKALRKLVGEYCQIIENRWASVAKNGQKTSASLLKNTLNTLASHNARWRYGVWGLAFTASALGVGALIPKLQYWMTRVLTGKDTHPGLAAVSQRVGHA